MHSVRCSLALLALLVACQGADDQASIDAREGIADGGIDAAIVDAPVIDAAVDARVVDAAVDAASGPSDPTDPVVDVPVFQGAYQLARLSTRDTTPNAGIYYRDIVGESRISPTRVRYARHRDRVVVQDKLAAQFMVFDQATATLSAPVTQPSDVTGPVTVRGGLVYAGGLGRLYSYEIATGMWRSRLLPGAGTCHHVVAGATRVFALCANPAGNGATVYVTWANKSMSDPAPVGMVTPAHSAATAWITAAPGEDIAYFSSLSPTTACIGRATPTTLAGCALQLSAGSYAGRSLASEDGQYLYVKRGTSSPYDLLEVNVTSGQALSVGGVEAFATCPDGSVVFQRFVMSFRRAGGVTTDLTLMSGAESDMGCPLRRL